jgi:tetratricopeptide (TPR) repeat protein
MYLGILIFLTMAVPGRAESFKSWMARASREEREKNKKGAIESYSYALSVWKKPDGNAVKAKALCARGVLRDGIGQEAGALADYNECLRLDKKNAKILHRRGQLRMKAHQTTLAIDDFYQAISLDMRFGAAYEDRAQAYEKIGDLIFAAEDYRHACELKVASSCAKAKKFPSAAASARPRKLTSHQISTRTH